MSWVAELLITTRITTLPCNYKDSVLIWCWLNLNLDEFRLLNQSGVCFLSPHSCWREKCKVERQWNTGLASNAINLTFITMARPGLTGVFRQIIRSTLIALVSEYPLQTVWVVFLSIWEVIKKLDWHTSQYCKDADLSKSVHSPTSGANCV